MSTRTYTAEDLAGLLGVSTWAVYESVRRGEPPVPPIRVGRRVLFAKAAVDRLLGVETSEAPGDHPGTIASTSVCVTSDPIEGSGGSG